MDDQYFLQYFDQENQNINNIISSVNSFFLEYKDNYIDLLDIQKKIIEIYSQKKLDYDSLKNLLDLLQNFIQKCGDVLSSSFEFKDSLSKIITL